MSVGNYGRQVANQVKDQVTKAIKDKLRPIIIQYVAPVALGIVIIIGLIGSASGTSSGSASGGEWETGPGGNYVNVTNGITAGVEYLMYWENFDLRKYIKGNRNYDSYIARYVTQDKQNYICYTDYPSNDHGDRNFAYGICHTPNNGGEYWHQTEYSQAGIDITTGAYNNYGTSTLPVAKVDEVFSYLYEVEKTFVLNKFNGIELSQNQLDALICIKYQYGNIGNAVSLYQSGGDFKTEFQVVKASGGYYQPMNYDSTNNKEGRTGDRAQANYELFTNNVYKLKDGTTLTQNNYPPNGGNESLVEVAQRIHDHIRTNSYAYSCEHNVNNGYTNSCTCNGQSYFGKNPSSEYYDIRAMDCSAYVSWVLYEYLGESVFPTRYNSTAFNDRTKWLEGWTEVDMNNIQAGDILVTNGHVGIYIGNGRTLEAGSTESIRRQHDYGNIQSVINVYNFAIRIQ